MPNNQVNVAELNRRNASSAPLRLLRLMRDLEVFADELCNAEETIGQPVWTYQDPLAERLRRVGISDQKVEDFNAWRRTISSLTSGDSCDENQLAKIVAAEAAGLTLLAELVASLRKGNSSESRHKRSIGGYRGLEWRLGRGGADCLAWVEMRSDQRPLSWEAATSITNPS